MKVLIIEDERYIASKLARMLGEIDSDIEIVDILDSVEAVKQYFSSAPTPQVDLIMSDISLGDGLVFEALSAVDVHAHIVFVTAYDSFAIQAFKFNGIDYILKPPTADDLKAALARARSLAPSTTPAAVVAPLVRTSSSKDYRHRFLVRTDGGDTRVIDIDDVLLIRAVPNGLAITVDGVEWINIGISLLKLEEKLDPKVFFRISRQYIISISVVAGIKWTLGRKLKILPADGFGFTGELIVSRDRTHEMRSWLRRNANFEQR